MTRCGSAEEGEGQGALSESPGFFLDLYAGRSHSSVGSGRGGTRGFAARRLQREAAFPRDDLARPIVGERAGAHLGDAIVGQAAHGVAPAVLPPA